MTNNDINLLIVEDELSIGSLMEMEFQDLGYQTKVVGLVSDAVKVIQDKSWSIDLCILDLRLPDGDGLSLLQAIKQIYPHVPVILMTGHGNKSTVIEALKLGAYDYIEKPFSISNDLFPVVNRADAAIRLQKENNSLNEQILHQSKLAALGELSATVLHDVRGPLSAIQVTCEDLSDEVQENGQVDAQSMEEHLKHIRKACDRIKKLVENLRCYARQDAKDVYENRALDLLIEDSLYLVQQKVRKFGVKVTKNLDSSVNNLLLHCLPNKFEQVIMNLCSNACDAMSPVERRELIIEARLDQDALCIDIKDTGTGISKENLDRIFDNFFTTKPRGEGTGLGLKIVRNIVREHGGDLLLSSEIGVGTTFTVKMPRDKISFASDKAEPTEPPQTDHKAA